MKTEIYSWRLSEELKSDLEREARLRQLPVASLLEVAVRDWLKKSGEDVAGDEAQRKLHAAVEDCIGTLAGLAGATIYLRCPYAPHEVIGVMHLAGAEQKSHVFRLNRLDGGTIETALRYGATRQLCGRALELSA